MSEVSFAARDPAVAAEAPLDRTPRPVLFTGDNAEFRRLVMRGALLEIVTAGFYRFWLATKMRRHLWSHTIVGEDALEYIGSARDLLFGFFFSLVFLTPAYLVYFLITVEAERYKAFASLPLLLFFLAFSQYANYGARRYRLHKTSWRGLRFGMGGSGLAYMARAIGWGVVIALSLGLALPWAQASLERYKMRHTFYGDLRGGFVGRGGEFFKRGWWVWLICLAIVAAPLSFREPSASNGIRFAIWMFVYVFGSPVLYAAFKTAQWRWWLRGLRLADIRVEPHLTMRAFLGNYLAFFGIVVGVVVVFAGLAVLASLPFYNPNAQPPAFLVAIWIVFYVATFVVIGIATRIYFVQRVWKIVAGSLLVHGLETAETVSARDGGAASAINEGFADNLDVVGF